MNPEGYGPQSEVDLILPLQWEVRSPVYIPECLASFSLHGRTNSV